MVLKTNNYSCMLKVNKEKDKIFFMRPNKQRLSMYVKSANKKKETRFFSCDLLKSTA